MKRVAITGMGAVTPVGLTFPDSFEAVKLKRSGLAPITRFDASALKWQHAGELKGFDPLKHVTKKDILRYDPFALYALAAAQEALRDSSLESDKLKNAGMVLGSGRGGISTLEEAAINNPSAFTMAGTTVSMAASLAGARLGLKGPVLGLSCACASGTAAIGTAYDMVRSGRLDVAFTGGAEAPICPLCVKGYGRAGALSESGIVKPFHPERDGFVLGEGAAVLVLESMEHAQKRGARIYAELAGYGNTSDTGHPTQPDAEGEARAMRAALNEAGISPDEVMFIMAHATGTRLGDQAESDAISEVFGDTLPEIGALKEFTGHMLAASGAFEAAVATRSIYEFSRGLDGDTIMHCLSNSFGFGGVNTSLAFRSV
jgi:3-oxoacyl-[acyl-carrier-protein] synthase II